MDLEEWVDADRWQSRGQRRGGQWLSGNKSAEASRSHRENVTKKSTTWLKRGAGSGGTRSRKEETLRLNAKNSISWLEV